MRAQNDSLVLVRISNEWDLFAIMIYLNTNVLNERMRHLRYYIVAFAQSLYCDLHADIILRLDASVICD